MSELQRAYANSRVLRGTPVLLKGLVSGEVDGRLPDSIEGQARNIFGFLGEVLKLNGLPASNIVEMTVYAKAEPGNEGHRAFEAGRLALTPVFRDFFGENSPVRAYVGVLQLPSSPEALLEISSTLMIPNAHAAVVKGELEWPLP